MKQEKCQVCKEILKCNCFWIEDLDFEDNEGHFESGDIPFCSVKCAVEFNKKDEVTDPYDLKMMQHAAECEVLGNLDPEYVKGLQKIIQEDDMESHRREGYWRRRVQQVCAHRCITFMDGLYGEKGFNWYCMDCEVHFKNKPDILRGKLAKHAKRELAKLHKKHLKKIYMQSNSCNKP